MSSFTLNGIIWEIQTVPPDSYELVDRTGNLTVGTTDLLTSTIYLSSELSGSFKTTVLLHEIGHAVMYSFNLINELHSFVDPINWIFAEEWVCNFLADYSRKALRIAKGIETLNDNKMFDTITKVLEELFR